MNRPGKGKGMNILSPSILAADFWKLGEQIKEAERAGAQYLHVDVMDGMFVPSISFGMPILKSLRGRTEMFLDVHLMVERPERYVEAFADCGADIITFHIEATEDVKDTIDRIRAKGRKAGLTIKPSTPALAATPYLELVDMVLVMTVEPGFGGQKIIPGCVEKVREIRAMAQEKSLNLDIEVDGGITIENVENVLAAGANVIVAGSAVFGGNIAENVGTFLRRME